MGQYFTYYYGIGAHYISIDRLEFKDSGLGKQWYSISYKNEVTETICSMLYHQPAMIALIGDDYADKALFWTQVYERGDSTSVPKRELDYHGKYAVNHEKKQFFSFDRTKELENEKTSSYIGDKEDFILGLVNPLACMVLLSSDQYGGLSANLTGTWANDLISIEDEKPAGFREIEVMFSYDMNKNPTAVPLAVNPNEFTDADEKRFAELINPLSPTREYAMRMMNWLRNAGQMAAVNEVLENDEIRDIKSLSYYVGCTLDIDVMLLHAKEMSVKGYRDAFRRLSRYLYDSDYDCRMEDITSFYQFCNTTNFWVFSYKGIECDKQYDRMILLNKYSGELMELDRNCKSLPEGFENIYKDISEGVEIPREKGIYMLEDKLLDIKGYNQESHYRGEFYDI